MVMDLRSMYGQKPLIPNHNQRICKGESAPGIKESSQCTSRGKQQDVSGGVDTAQQERISASKSASSGNFGAAVNTKTNQITGDSREANVLTDKQAH